MRRKTEVKVDANGDGKTYKEIGNKRGFKCGCKSGNKCGWSGR